MSPADARTRSTLRWGAAVAGLLAAQSLLLAGLFWLLATGGQVRDVERHLAEDCREFAVQTPGQRAHEVREMLDQDVHRDRFLALFDAGGQLIEGNVARLPSGLRTGTHSAIAEVTPTELPGKTSDTGRLVLCPLPGGELLLTGVDLDDAERTVRVIERTLLLALVPGLALALGVGLIAGRRAALQVDAVRRLANRIMAGDLHGRLPVSRDPDSFGLLCANINTMLDRIEMLMVEVRGIGDDIAHQIRTPLTRLRARLERQMEGAADHAASTDGAADTLRDIDGVLAIVAALLRIREIEDHARRSRFAPVDLARLVADACDLHGPTVEEAGMVFACRIEAQATVTGDSSLLMEAVSNLIDNAVKFGPPRGTVSLVLRSEAGAPVIAVADQGSGVLATERELVTQRFYRGRHEAEGVGLGLSLVKAIADLHGCRLVFADRGSAVRIECPPAQD